MHISGEFTRQIVNYLQSQQEVMAALLERLVLIESPSSEPPCQNNILSVLDERLQLLDLEVMRITGQRTGGQLLAFEQGASPDEPTQLLLGHCDTVWPVGTLTEMPFVRHENIIRGPGAYDMKAGLVQMVFALQALKSLSLTLPVSPIILINSDEEIGSPESGKLIRETAQRVDRVFVLEPSLGQEGKIKTARKGVGQYKLKVTGRAAHAGLDPEKGASAIVEMAALVHKLYWLNDYDHGVSVNVGTINGGVRPNVVAPTAEAVVDVRVPTMEVGRRLEATIQNLTTTTPGTSLQISGRINRPPMEKTDANRQLWLIASELGRKLGLLLEEGTAGGGSDGNITSQYTATLDGLGAVGDGAHAQHEFVFLDKMVERSALLALLLTAPSVRS